MRSSDVHLLQPFWQRHAQVWGVEKKVTNQPNIKATQDKKERRRPRKLQIKSRSVQIYVAATRPRTRCGLARLSRTRPPTCMYIFLFILKLPQTCLIP